MYMLIVFKPVKDNCQVSDEGFIDPGYSFPTIYLERL